MVHRLIFGFVIGAVSAAAFAQATVDLKANPVFSAYAEDRQGLIVRSRFGLCWRTGYWTTADAVPDCEERTTGPISQIPLSPTVQAISATESAPVTAKQIAENNFQ